MMTGQMSIFDYMPTMQQEPDVGEFITKHGQVICHIMRPGYIGKKVCFDVSTESMRMFQVGVLEKIVTVGWYYNGKLGDCDRAIIYTGKKQRSLVTLSPGVNIYECLPWDAYPERMKAIGGRA